MRRILIVDDVRTIEEACGNSGWSAEHVADDQYTLIRPFRHDGNQLLTSEQNFVEILAWNPPFDVMILDNDLGIDTLTGKVLEGFQLLKDLLANNPDKAPGRVLSCSANFERRRQIVSYFDDWKRVR